MGYKRFIALCIGLGASLFADNMHVVGTFDFNNIGQSELLQPNGLAGPLAFVQLDSE